MLNLSYENEFDLHGNEHVHLGGTHFHMNGFAKIHFDTEAKGNSKMAYSLISLFPQNDNS